MPEHKELYIWSKREAQRNNELPLWRESHNENCVCAREIEQGITENYKDNRLPTDFMKDIIRKFGFERVNWVLANTVKEGMHDGRYSAENKQWAKGFYIPKEEGLDNHSYTVTSHPCLVDAVVSRARKEWQALGLYDKSHCYDESMDFKGKVVVLRPDVLKDEYKTPEYQLFYASNGNGCNPHALGTKVFGRFLKDGEKTSFRRSDFLGVLKADLLPDWAQEKIASIENPTERSAPTNEQETADQETEENKNLNMGGGYSEDKSISNKHRARQKRRQVYGL